MSGVQTIGYLREWAAVYTPEEGKNEYESFAGGVGAVGFDRGGDGSNFIFSKSGFFPWNGVRSTAACARD